jgi:hypothetical protein
MSITISGTIKIKDDKGENYIINADDLGFEVDSTTDAPMGTKIFYGGSYELSDLSVKVTIVEYPDGAMENDPVIEIEGGDLIENNLYAELTQ